ncbi:DNA polymerase subunit gamma-2, mitochondrial-like isoform X2 [Dysidea avara]|uniref:DNA polymerase subunit gamma-2, mitochondrial-like isoform X2 n=1 Tax=Dysidea avara TaxID=196820 RepID=UPI00332F5362
MPTKAARTKVPSKSLLEAVRAFCARKGFVSNISKEPGAPEVYGQLGSELKRNIQDAWWQNVVTSRGNVWGVESGLLLNKSLSDDWKKSAVDDIIKLVNKSPKDVEAKVGNILDQCKSHVGLRPSLTEESFHRCLSHLNTGQWKLPFGVAQVGKCWRSANSGSNVSVVETEEMSLSYFCSHSELLDCYMSWQKQRLRWWRKFANKPENFQLIDQNKSSSSKFINHESTIEYQFPWGKGEVEKIICSSENIYHQLKSTEDIRIPSLVQASAQLDKGMQAYLFDGYKEMEREEQGKLVTVMCIYPLLAPVKVAVIPSTPSEHKLCVFGQYLAEELRQHRMKTVFCEDVNKSLNENYKESDEVGVPYCIVVDPVTLENGVVAVRSRDTTLLEYIKSSEVCRTLKPLLRML